MSKVDNKKRLFPFPARILFNMYEANYAVSTDGSDRLDFVRIRLVRPYKTGWRKRQFEGCIMIQSQHSDDWVNRFAVAEDGSFTRLSSTWSPERAASILATIVTDQRGAASRYGQMLGHCCRCGKALTDERSRWYGIGPECEKHWPEIIYGSDELRGEFVPSQSVL